MKNKLFFIAVTLLSALMQSAQTSPRIKKPTDSTSPSPRSKNPLRKITSYGNNLNSPSQAAQRSKTNRHVQPSIQKKQSSLSTHPKILTPCIIDTNRLPTDIINKPITTKLATLTCIITSATNHNTSTKTIKPCYTVLVYNKDNVSLQPRKHSFRKERDAILWTAQCLQYSESAYCGCFC